MKKLYVEMDIPIFLEEWRKENTRTERTRKHSKINASRPSRCVAAQLIPKVEGIDSQTTKRSQRRGENDGANEEKDSQSAKQVEADPKKETSSDPSEEDGAVRHIHPCICDLSDEAKLRISAHQKAKAELHQKYVTRRAEIEVEKEHREELRREREREKREQQELFGDEYEVVGEKKKRKKRSARRASMVSLGVRQVINWRKEPKLKVILNKTWYLRNENTRYCGQITYSLPELEDVDFRKEPLIPIRSTRAYMLRYNANHEYKDKLIAAEDKRPPFLIDVCW